MLYTALRTIINQNLPLYFWQGLYLYMHMVMIQRVLCEVNIINDTQ